MYIYIYIPSYIYCPFLIRFEGKHPGRRESLGSMSTMSSFGSQEMPSDEKEGRWMRIPEVGGKDWITPLSY